MADTAIRFDWPLALYFLTAIGSQVLGVRGSEKSLYGKFFEKLVLAGVLHALGFDLVEEGNVQPRSYWLSSRGNKRESDATLIYELGQGVRFDIGFIGPGNTEISLDKVSRFEREAEVGGLNFYIRTIILVDRIGRRSRITELAAAIDGVILQMSMAYWPQALGNELEQVFPDYVSPFRDLDGAILERAIRERVSTAPFDRALRLASDGVEDEVEADEGD